LLIRKDYEPTTQRSSKLALTVPISGLEPDSISRMGIGFIPEDRRIFPGLSVDENLRLGLLQAPGRSRLAMSQAIDKAYQKFPKLHERRAQLGTTLSGGEQQMLAIARVLVGTPKLLLIDEPTEGLAPQIVDEILQIITDLKSEGLTIVLVEQNIDWALQLTDRIAAVERGQIVFSGLGNSAEDRETLLTHISV
jgi:branched-chain amino acid transport system ATP-binding protein